MRTRTPVVCFPCFAPPSPWSFGSAYIALGRGCSGRDLVFALLFEWKTNHFSGPESAIVFLVSACPTAGAGDVWCCPRPTGNKIVAGDVDILRLFMLSQHPDSRPRLEGMKEGISKYNDIASGIMAVINGRMPREMAHLSCDWWRCNSGEPPSFAFVLRAVLTHSPHSCPPQRLFSIFNATFDGDQMDLFGYST